ncbi:hypothetical protein F5X68DRAFT_249900 [Plectosphaerella plurivora]|uniref:Uncharacterized protein n=1 Tax=Plectosphaerella plurivora TaxID=936078 RepID=A0A9P8UZN0_9PEZI|nr:hypothetical protein F5X68DRAFT_249900 [Plectosphaerella plurivora]
MPGFAHRPIIDQMSRLSDDEQLLGDDIILALAQANLGDPALTEEVRTRMWTAVFADWDSKLAPEHPGPIPKQKRPKTSIPVGTLAIAAPLDYVSIPTHRQVGCPVYLRPVVDGGDNINLRFEFIDRKKRQVHMSFVDIDILIQINMYSLAIKHYDDNEVIRVSSYNKELAIYWIRCRVLALVFDEFSHARLPVDAKPENIHELTQPVLASDMIIRIRDFVNLNSVKTVRGEGF